MSGATVLCIDDLSHQLAVRRAQLESYGYSVQTASSGGAALKILKTIFIAAVVLEYKREGIDAEAVAFLIRQRFPTVPMLLVSAYSHIPDRVLCLFDDYVLKGIPTQELVAKIERVTNVRSANARRSAPQHWREPEQHKAARIRSAP